MDSTLKLIQKFQEDKDTEALRVLLSEYFIIVERIIEQYDHPTLPKEILREKARERFSFIIEKYRLDVQMPIELFLKNTYTFFFRTL
jgi:tRNA A-37 threonylcarbamoyl transferase component Bud32